MATPIRAQCSYQVGSMLPRDAHTINPVFQVAEGIVWGDANFTTLAEDLATAIKAKSSSGSARQLTVKIYEIKDPVAGTPNRPRATAVRDVGVSSGLSYPGEVACCLSFYGGTNAPHQRGRLYLPCFMFGAGPAGDRPSAGDRASVLSWKTPFEALGGVNVDWGIWSQKRKVFTKATNCFVDDEWDTQRRRGLRYTTRTAGTTTG